MNQFNLDKILDNAEKSAEYLSDNNEKNVKTGGVGINLKKYVYFSLFTILKQKNIIIIIIILNNNNNIL